MNVLHYDNTVSSLKVFRRKLKTEQPDLVHLHGCWSWKSAIVMLWCRQQLIPVVISPERQLMPWHVLHHYWFYKLPKLLLFQRGMVKRAHGIIASTEQERNTLLSISLYPGTKNDTSWNNRVTCIKDLPGKYGLTDEQRQEQYGGFYQKVIDSHSFMVMTDTEKEAENLLLWMGLSEETPTLTQEQETLIKELQQGSWRKIMLHAEEEGILQEIRHGASLLQLAPMSIADIERFPQRGKKNRLPLRNDKALLKSLRLREFCDEKHASTIDKQICIVLLNFINELNHGTLSRRHLADLYTTLRYTDYNETKVTQILELLKEKKTTARLLQILHDSLHLEEGFMPMKARNDRKTRQLRDVLYRLNIQ